MAITENNPRIGWHNLAVVGTVSATSEQDAYPAVNLANPATFQQWRAAANEPCEINIDLPEAEGINYVGVYGHNWGSRSTTVELEYSNDGIVWTAATPPTLPDLEDRVFFRTFDTVVASSFRIVLTPQGDLYDDPPEASVVYLGRVLTIPRRIYVGHAPITLGRDATASTGFSEAGQFLGRVLTNISLESGVELQNLDPVFVRDELDPFLRSAIDRPFFWAWRPGTYPEEVAYAWFIGKPPRPTNQRANGLMQTQWALQGVTLPPHLR